MVGFGDYLIRVGKEHGAQGEGLAYERLKALLQGAVEAQRGRGRSDDSEGDSSEGGEKAQDAVTPTLPPPTPPSGPQCAAVAFISSLEEEVSRVNNFVKRKLRSLQRVRKALDVSRSLRGSKAPVHEQSIGLMQLSNVYDDVILVLWFMYLNSIAVSKIVKKYNKNFPESAYKVDPSRWLFLRAGLVHAQKAKAAIEAEFAACVDNTVSDTERILVERNQEVCELAQGMRDLIRDHKHHLYVQGDPTEWAVAVDLAGQPCCKQKSRVSHTDNRCKQVIDDEEVHRKFDMQGLAGRGAYGVVHRARHRATNKTMAVKTIYDAWSHPVLGQRTYREIEIMQQLRHPNIVILNEVIVNGNKRDVHLVMPFIPHTCEDLLAQRQLLPQHKKWFMLQLMSALAYLHARGVVHRDLKLSNLLVDDTPKLFLSDFGLARTLSGGSSTTVTDNPDYVQTQWYRAPEVLLCSRQVTSASDMWSAGCIIAELLTGVPLFPGQDDQHQLELILACCPVPAECSLQGCMKKQKKATRSQSFIPKRRVADMLDACWQSGVQDDFERTSVVDLISKLLQFEPEGRLTAVEVLSHPWLMDDSFPKRARDDTVASAQPLCGEDAVLLDLTCTQLHRIGQYREAVSGSPKVTFMRKRQEVRIDMHESAALIQRAWRWKRYGGSRPPLRRCNTHTHLCRGSQKRRAHRTPSCAGSIYSSVSSARHDRQRHRRQPSMSSIPSTLHDAFNQEHACGFCVVM